MSTTTMTVQDIAEHLNVDPKTVYRMVNRGDLPGFKVGGSWRFQKDDIDDWIAKQKEAAGTEASGQSTGRHRGRGRKRS